MDKKHLYYEAPLLSVTDIAVENGFAQSDPETESWSIYPPDFGYGGTF